MEANEGANNLSNRGDATRILTRVQRDMPIYAADNEKIGRVASVQMGENTTIDDERGGTAMGADDVLEPRPDVTEGVRRDVNMTDVSASRQDELQHSGFIEMDADGLFAADRYITPSQIQSVDADGVRLNVARDQLRRK